MVGHDLLSGILREAIVQLYHICTVIRELIRGAVAAKHDVSRHVEFSRAY
jgi:hypothetical protein